MELFDLLFRSEDVEKDFSDRACLQGMLDFEAALGAGGSASRRNSLRCRGGHRGEMQSGIFRLTALARGAKLAGNLAIPLVKALTALVAQENKEAAGYVHWGATSQDVIDTGLVLQLRLALKSHRSRSGSFGKRTGRACDQTSINGDGRAHLDAAGGAHDIWRESGGLARRHGSPARDAERDRRRALVLQFGGAVGTLGALGERGGEVAKLLAEELALAVAGDSLAHASGPDGGNRHDTGPLRRNDGKNREGYFAAWANGNR